MHLLFSFHYYLYSTYFYHIRTYCNDSMIRGFYLCNEHTKASVSEPCTQELLAPPSASIYFELLHTDTHMVAVGWSAVCDCWISWSYSLTCALQVLKLYSFVLWLPVLHVSSTLCRRLVCYLRLVDFLVILTNLCTSGA